MTKRGVALIVVLVLGVGLLIYANLDYFRKPVIRISSTVRMTPAQRRRAKTGNDVAPVPTFRLGAKYNLTSVKVIRVDDLKNKGFARPLWELASDPGTDSDPVDVFLYGKPIGRMNSVPRDAAPEPLTNNVTYRLLIAAGKLKGQHDFTITNSEDP